MESDRKKRSRSVEGGWQKKKKKGRETKWKDEARTKVVISTPAEEEFSEFFAIVRRMQEAVEYFEKGSRGGVDGSDELKKKTEEPATTGVNDAEARRKIKNNGNVGIFDLNNIPSETDYNSH
ncbi:hypothetical protein L1887_14726 [Cichorium endivia]|nr:hypothetical protein L1887_14726 [Cichorium endivia]